MYDYSLETKRIEKKLFKYLKILNSLEKTEENFIAINNINKVIAMNEIVINQEVSKEDADSIILRINEFLERIEESFSNI